MITIRDIVESKQLDTAKMKEVKGGAGWSFSSLQPSIRPEIRDYGVISYWNSLYPTLK